jgi:hypothetical protein
MLEQRRPAYQARRSDGSTTLSPCSALIGSGVTAPEPDLRREAVEVGHDPVEDLLRPADEVHLVDRQHDVADTQQPCHRRVPARLLDHACRASTRTIATSAVEAPVTMLRVYCSCPGVSARMKRRRGVAK